jgi:hypothetical protein
VKSLFAFIVVVFVGMMIINNAYDVLARFIDGFIAALIVLLMCALGVALGRMSDERINYD